MMHTRYLVFLLQTLLQVVEARHSGIKKLSPNGLCFERVATIIAGPLALRPLSELARDLQQPCYHGFVAIAHAQIFVPAYPVFVRLR